MGRCASCGKSLVAAATGRPRLYCGDRCRRRAFVERRQLGECRDRHPSQSGLPVDSPGADADERERLVWLREHHWQKAQAGDKASAHLYLRVTGILHELSRAVPPVAVALRVAPTGLDELAARRAAREAEPPAS